MGPQVSRIILAGGSGFIGRHLADHLASLGHEVVILTRDPAKVETTSPVRAVAWDGRTIGPWAHELDGAKALVNLAGRNVNCRYHRKNRDAILHSRLDSARILGQALHTCKHPPAVWVQAATLAIYGDRGEERLTEESPTGQTFSPDVARAWEAAVDEAALPTMRQVILRISFALGTDGGALPTLATLARLGLGGSVASGQQYYSWIHIDDLCRIFQLAIEHPQMSGIYNTTSPLPVRNEMFMRRLRQAVGRPWSPPAPTWAIHLGCFFMRTEAELALRSRYGVPRRLIDMGFSFDYPDLDTAMNNLYPPPHHAKCLVAASSKG